MLRKKSPAIPTAPLAKTPPDLNIPDDLFEGCSGGETYSSSPFKAIAGFESYAKDLYKAVRKKGKGKILFPDESQFLNELDTHYYIMRYIALSSPLKYAAHSKSRENILRI